MKKRCLVSILCLILTFGVFQTTSSAETIDIYPYGQNMGTSEVTLAVDETGDAYKWQESTTENGTYTDIEGATNATYTFIPTENNWYRCLIDGKETNAVNLIKVSSKWYISNGEMAYCAMNKDGFNVVGWYDDKWIECSYDKYWKVLGSTDSSPSSANVSSASSEGVEAVRLNFDSNDSRSVIVTVIMESAGYSVAVGTDTELNGWDSCPLTAIENNNTLSQIQMVAASKLEEAETTDAAMVIKPITSASYYWIGAYSFSCKYGMAYAYNAGGSDYDDHYTFASDPTRVTQIDDKDSAMNISWVNIPTNEVSFTMSLGTVAQTGASLGGAESTSTTITVDVSDGYYYQLIDSDGNPVSDWVQPIDGKITFEGLESETTYTINAVPDSKYNEGTVEDDDKMNLGDVTTNIDTNNTGSSSGDTGTSGTIEVEATRTSLTFTNLNTTDYTYILKGDDIVDTEIPENGTTITGLSPNTTYKLYATKIGTDIGSDPMDCVTLEYDDITNISDISKTYDGTEVSAPTYDKIGTGTVTIEYKLKDEDDSTYTTIAPKNAGTYVVRITVTSDDSIEALGTKEFTIAQKEISIEWIAPSNLVYDGTAKVPTAIVKDVVAGEIVKVKIELTANNDNVNVGEFTYYVAELDNENYKLPTNTTSPEYTIYTIISVSDNNEATMTGDTSNMWLYSILALVSLGGIGVCLYRRKYQI